MSNKLLQNLTYKTTPIIELDGLLFQQKKVRVLVKCEYQNHSLVSGNKWWKLKYNLQEAAKLNKKKLLTFGGAYSNHIYATAAAANDLSFESIGIIRGEKSQTLSKTLLFALEKGMSLHFISREEYKTKDDLSFIEELRNMFDDFYLIPEGGTNHLALQGVKEWGQQLNMEVHFDYLCTACGTGGTMAGFVRALPDKKILGFSALKGNFLEEGVSTLLDLHESDHKADADMGKDVLRNWAVNGDYHFGGYAKTNDALNKFIREFEIEYSIPLEHVYTAKMFYGLKDLIKHDYFNEGSTILAIHTGGLQGRLSTALFSTL